MSSASLSSADTAVSPSRSFSIDDEEAAMNMNGVKTVDAEVPRARGLHPAIHIMCVSKGGSTHRGPMG